MADTSDSTTADASIASLSDEPLDGADRAVHGPSEVLASLGFEGVSLRLLKNGHNAHWLVRRQGAIVGVLRRYGPNRLYADAAWEVSLLQELSSKGWRVPVALTPMVESGGRVWCLFAYIAGRGPSPRTEAGSRRENFDRGVLIARLHEDVAESTLSQRPGWSPASHGLFPEAANDPAEDVLNRWQSRLPDQVHVLRRYLDRIADAAAQECADVVSMTVVHGDVSQWNLRIDGAEPTGLLDFDLAHRDLAVSEFALSWRGRDHQVIAGYLSVRPLSVADAALVLPSYWAMVVAAAVQALRNNRPAELKWAFDYHLGVRDDEAASWQDAVSGP